MKQPTWRFLLYAAGIAMMGYGLWGQVFGSDTKPIRVTVLIVVAALAHDLVFAPLVITLGWLLRRVVRGHVRGSVQGAVLVATSLLLIAIPGMGRYGARGDNASVLPRNYSTGLLIALGTVAVCATLQVTFSVLRRRP